METLQVLTVPEFSLSTQGLLLFVLGSIITFIGMIFFIVAAFQVGIGWGFAVLLIPLANVLFATLHWEEAKKGFLLKLAGLVFIFFGLISFAEKPAPEKAASRSGGSAGATNPFQGMVTQVLREREKIEGIQARREQASEGVPGAGFGGMAQGQDLGTRMEASRRKFEELAAWFERLEAKRKTLDSGDAVAVKAFNDEAARYQAEHLAAKTESERIKSEAKTSSGQ